VVPGLQSCNYSDNCTTASLTPDEPPAEHPDAAKIGLVVYPGDEVVELRWNVWGVPDWYLLGAL
jgi:hypothetical protein